MTNQTNTTDKRPDPKPRKRANLWQAYQQWNDLVELRKRHTLKLSSIEAGKSNMDAQSERDFIDDTGLDKLVDNYKKVMIRHGEDTPPWKWLTSIKGLKEGSLAAQLIAQIDDISNADTISALWRFAGYAVQDGRRERRKAGEKAHYNARLSAVCWNIGEQFVRQQTPLYAEYYYAEKARLRGLHPEPEPTDSGPWKTAFTDSHVDRMARRKTVKLFLSHLWIIWRTAEGLPVTLPYIHTVGGHTNYIEPPVFAEAANV